MPLLTWNEKIIDHSDGYGYIIREGEIGEIVIYSYTYPSGKKLEVEEMRICGIDEIRAVGKALIEKAKEMEEAHGV